VLTYLAECAGAFGWAFAVVKECEATLVVLLSGGAGVPHRGGGADGMERGFCGGSGFEQFYSLRDCLVRDPVKVGDLHLRDTFCEIITQFVVSYDTWASHSCFQVALLFAASIAR